MPLVAAPQESRDHDGGPPRARSIGPPRGGVSEHQLEVLGNDDHTKSQALLRGKALTARTGLPQVEVRGGELKAELIP
jgi:hypothetical protein